MARRLVTTHAILCDWHSALEQPQEIEASTQRTIGSGKTIDLCGFCALVWDFCGPRIEEIKQMIRPEVLEALLHSGRSAKDDDENPAEPLQLTMQEEAPDKPKAPPPPKKKAASGRGQWLPGVEQVICPLPHRAGSPDTYWVKVRDRGSHAKSSHKLLGPQVPYKLPDPGGPDAVSLPVKCFEHRVCADSGGYGFADESGLRCHILKSTAWTKVKHRDTTATPAQAHAPAA